MVEIDSLKPTNFMTIELYSRNRVIHSERGPLDPNNSRYKKGNPCASITQYFREGIP